MGIQTRGIGQSGAVVCKRKQAKSRDALRLQTEPTTYLRDALGNPARAYLRPSKIDRGQKVERISRFGAPELRNCIRYAALIEEGVTESVARFRVVRIERDRMTQLGFRGFPLKLFGVDVSKRHVPVRQRGVEMYRAFRRLARSRKDIACMRAQIGR